MNNHPENMSIHPQDKEESKDIDSQSDSLSQTLEDSSPSVQGTPQQRQRKRNPKNPKNPTPNDETGVCYQGPMCIATRTCKRQHPNVPSQPQSASRPPPVQQVAPTPTPPGSSDKEDPALILLLSKKITYPEYLEFKRQQEDSAGTQAQPRPTEAEPILVNPNSTASDEVNCQLYVKLLPLLTTKEGLKKVFQQYGKVVQVLLFEDGPQTLQWALIKFNQAKDAQIAASAKIMLADKKLTVSFSIKNKKKVDSESKLCGLGANCRNKNCQFDHGFQRNGTLEQTSSEVKIEGACKFGKNCNRKDTCNLQHPSAPPSKLDAPKEVCKFGSSCRFRETTCKKLHVTPAGDKDTRKSKPEAPSQDKSETPQKEVCQYPADKCFGVQNGSCMKQHRATTDDNECPHTAVECPGVRDGTCHKRHLFSDSNDKICKYQAAKCFGVKNGTCRKQHPVQVEEETITKVFTCKSKFKIASMPLANFQARTFIGQFEARYLKEVKFRQLDIDSRSVEEQQESIQSVELSGKKQKVEKAILEMTDLIAKLTVETETLPDAEISNKFREAYSKGIEKQFRVNLRQVGLVNWVISGHKEDIQAVKVTITDYVGHLKSLTKNEEIIQLPGAPNQALALVLQKNQSLLSKFEQNYQISEIQINPHRMRFLANPSVRQKAIDGLTEFILAQKQTLITNVYEVRDQTKVKFAKRFQNKLIQKGHGTKLEFISVKNDGSQQQKAGFYLNSAAALIPQDNQPDPYNWAYAITAKDANYNQQQDKTLQWFFYDWDQNKQIEQFHIEVMMDSNKRKAGCVMQKPIVGDQFQVKNNQHYEIYCLSDVVQNTTALHTSATQSRFRQRNTHYKTERVIARFDRPCFNKKPDQAALLDASKPPVQKKNVEIIEVMRLTGQKDFIEVMVKELDSLFNNTDNHQFKLPLTRQPSPKETTLIKTYLKTNFQAEAQVRTYSIGNVEIKVTGLKQNEIRLWANQHLSEYLRMDYPDEWEDSLSQHCEQVNLKTSRIKTDSQLWSDVVQQFMSRAPQGNPQVLQIHAIQNLELWAQYQQEIKNLEMKSKSKPRTLRLWHGCIGQEPRMIYSKDGLNINYSKQGMWGKGIYFAVNANYSCPSYCFQVPGQHQQYEVFAANVVIGNVIDTSVNSDNSLMCPPPIPGSQNEHYDSVKGHTNGSDVYIVYKNVKTYPGLLVRYQL